MSRKTLVGIDPGLVHTGMVVLRIDTRQRMLLVEPFVIEGDKSHPEQVTDLLESLAYEPGAMFIEAYRERANSYGTNPKMRELLADFRATFPRAKIVDNTGSKQVVLPAILEALGLTGFQTTHHQDLQAAARILVYGMLKDEQLNRLVYDILTDVTKGVPWPIERA